LHDKVSSQKEEMKMKDEKIQQKRNTIASYVEIINE